MANRNLGYDIGVDYDGASAANQAINDLHKFNTELDNVDQAAEEVGRQTGGMFDKAKSSWTEFSSAIGVVKGALSGVQQVAQQAWDTISRGADLDRVSGQAEALAGSIGTSWKSLLADMTEATGGMITQADLTASAVDIIGLGMAGTGEEVTRLSKLVGELGWDMQTLTLTLANQSTARLDSLGLSMTDVTDKVKKLKAAGLEADEAFKLAVIEAGEEKLNLLGSEAETTAGDLKKLEATWGDLMDRIAKGASEGAAPLASITLAELAISEAVDKGIISQKDWSKAQGEAVFTSKTYMEALSGLLDEIDAVAEAERNTAQYNEIITRQRQGATQAVIDQADAIQELGIAERRGANDEGLERQRQGWVDARIEVYAFKDALYEQSDALTAAADQADIAAAAHKQFATDAAAAWGEYVTAVQSSSGDAFSGAAFDPEQTYDAAQATYQIADAYGAGAKALGEMGQNLGIVNAEQAAYGLSVAQSKAIRETLAQAVQDEVITWSQYEEAVIAADNAVKGIGGETPEVTKAPPIQFSEADIAGAGDAGIQAIKDKFGDTKTWAGVGDTMQGAIDSAVTVAQGVVDGFVNPDEVYQVIMDYDGTAVETGVAASQTLLDGLEDKTVTVHFAATTSDAFDDAIDEVD